MALGSSTRGSAVYVRTRADVTIAGGPPYGVRMRTDRWPQREAFVAYLDDLRKRRGFRTNLALADASGVSHTAISNWRQGKQRPSLESLQQIAEVLGVPAHTLAEMAGVVDPSRFGQSAPPGAGDVEELAKIIQLVYDTPGLTPEDQEYFIQRAREDWEREQDAAEERAKDRTITRIEEWRRARSA